MRGVKQKGHRKYKVEGGGNGTGRAVKVCNSLVCLFCFWIWHRNVVSRSSFDTFPFRKYPPFMKEPRRGELPASAVDVKGIDVLIETLSQESPHR